VPKVSLPDSALQEIFQYGLYKQACVHPPQGLAATLQGCFNEDYQLPPWSNDYHFNINVQMIYTPVLATNRAEHLRPLWGLMSKWMPTLKENGEKFFGQKGALMLPHAVDDRCQVVGTFWTGTIDHACTAWMAYLAWQHYRYTMDEAVLNQTAWPLLVGAFEGYWAMLDRSQERWSLPVSVSPEYRGDRMDAWGRDASFQLAALHKITQILPQAAQVLGQNIDPRWAEVSAKVPPYTIVDDVYVQEWKIGGKRIGLWAGQDLPESHRHHSHLASIYPFVTIDPLEKTHRSIVETSLQAWTYRGAGGWSGWCVPWASTLWSRVNNPEAAVSWLHFWKENFTNEGRGTSHNASFKGVSVFSDVGWFRKSQQNQNREIMQLDAGFGALTAVLELLVQQRGEVIEVLPAIHHKWQRLSFERIRAEGAFLISAQVENGQVQGITVEALAGGKLRLAHHLGASYWVNEKAETAEIFEKTMAPGEKINLRVRP
jgi:hypothetical protein